MSSPNDGASKQKKQAAASKSPNDGANKRKKQSAVSISTAQMKTSPETSGDEYELNPRAYTDDNHFERIYNILLDQEFFLAIRGARVNTERWLSKNKPEFDDLGYVALQNLLEKSVKEFEKLLITMPFEMKKELLNQIIYGTELKAARIEAKLNTRKRISDHNPEVDANGFVALKALLAQHAS